MSKWASLAMILTASCAFDSSNAVDGDGAPVVYDARPPVDASDVDAATIDASPADASIPDAAPPDATPPDAALPDAEVCVGDLLGFDLLNMDRCDPNDPITNLVLNMNGDYEFDGDNLTLTDPADNPIALDIVVVPQTGGEDLLVVTVTDVQIAANSNLHLLGARPVVLISTGNMTIDGQILAMSRGALTGAGANVSAGCATGAGTNGETQTDGNTNDGGSGAGGAGFGTAGGEGAKVVNSAGNNSPAGAVAAVLTLEPLRGGCRGGDGGLDGGTGGNGGGAMHLAAAGTITINGNISSSGSGGGAVTGQSSGGGGAGSGGAVLIQAGSLVNNGFITVNGGGGGEGSRGGTTSAPGDDGFINSDNAANGGSSGSSGGDGGDGATANDAAVDGEEGNTSAAFASGGGGGGGGLGVVRIELVNP